MPVPCPYCGDQHPDGDKFCSATGRPLPVSPTAWYTAGPDKGVWDLMREALELYRAHARVFLMTAAVLVVPGSLVRACATAAVVSAPLESQAYYDTSPEIAHEAERLARLTFGGVTAGLLELGGWAITALILYGLAFPLTHGALTIAVADRILGGRATWREHWMLLFRRLGLLLTAVLPAAVLVMIGYFVLVIPGLLLSFFFVFVAPVVLIEGVGGTAALKRSFTLVRADWLRTALLLLTFGVLSGAAHWLADLFVPRGAVFFGNFLGDLLLLVVMPVPIIASVLLYFDLRHRVDGVTDDRLRMELEALR
jgi:hypothetical protein